jgi:curved DNA-binding protein CbpA
VAKTPLSPAEVEAIQRLTDVAAKGTHYELLGIDRRAEKDDIERAYRDFVREYHPDRFFSRGAGERAMQIEENFVHVTRAYRMLRDPKQRREYDKTLDAQGVTVPERAAPEAATGVEARFKPGSSPRAGASVPPTTAPSVPPTASPTSKPPSRPPPGMAKVQKQISEQLVRAKKYFENGKAEYDAGRFPSAESALYLATQFDPKNEEYRALHADTVVKARSARAKGYLDTAIHCETMDRVKEAVHNYRKAVECDPAEGVAHFRLAQLLLRQGEDSRDPVSLMRKAVAKEPKNIKYRLALAELYLQLGMHATAQREAQAAYDLDPKSDAAKALFKKTRR